MKPSIKILKFSGIWCYFIFFTRPGADFAIFVGPVKFMTTRAVIETALQTEIK